MIKNLGLANAEISDPVAIAPGTDSVTTINAFCLIIFAHSTPRRYPSFMASYIDVEKLALALSEHERARLAAKLSHSLPEINSKDDESGTIGFKTINSSMLRRVRYDPKNRFLEVVFRTGEKYRYKDVPPDEYNRLMNAESHGKYMQMYIIDHYDVVRLGN